MGSRFRSIFLQYDWKFEEWLGILNTKVILSLDKIPGIFIEISNVKWLIVSTIRRKLQFTSGYGEIPVKVEFQKHESTYPFTTAVQIIPALVIQKTALKECKEAVE